MVGENEDPASDAGEALQEPADPAAAAAADDTAASVELGSDAAATATEDSSAKTVAAEAQPEAQKAAPTAPATEPVPAAEQSEADPPAPEAVEKQSSSTAAGAVEKPAPAPEPSSKSQAQAAGHGKSAPLKADASKPSDAAANKPAATAAATAAAAAGQEGDATAAVGASPRVSKSVVGSELSRRSHASQSMNSTMERLTSTVSAKVKHMEEEAHTKTSFFIGTGISMTTKTITKEEEEALVERLCVPKKADDNMPAKPHAVKLVYEGAKETYVPVKHATTEENVAYMSHLYERCQETRQKTLQTLQDRYLQPLDKPAH